MISSANTEQGETHATILIWNDTINDKINLLEVTYLQGKISKM